MNKQKDLYIYCTGGLGNRFHCLVAGLHICEEADLKPIIVWPSASACRIKFSDVFASQFDVRDNISNIDQSYLISHINLSNHFSNINSFTSLDSVSKSFKNSSFNFLVFMCCRIDAFKDFNIKVINKLKFRQSYIIRAAEVIADREFIGVHLRSTDYQPRDFNDVYTDIKSRKDTFFVCSDSEDLQSKFSSLDNVFVYEKQAYPTKIDGNKSWGCVVKDKFGITTNGNVERSADSIKHSIVDLLVLSKSKELYTNIFTGSTFYTTAKMLSKYYNEN